VRIRIPKSIWRLSVRFEEWGNKRTFGLLRVDICLALAFVLGGAWSLYSGGWFVLAQFALLFLFIAICGLWMR
jgi:hypothetical protein